MSSSRLGGALLGCLALAACADALTPVATTLPEGDIGLTTLTQPPGPVDILARSRSEADEAARRASDARLAELVTRRGATMVEGPQIPLFFESEIGRAYLQSSNGRAIAKGAPEERCPSLGVALDRPSAGAAVTEALGACLSQLDAAPPPDEGEAVCGCRVLAAGPAVLRPLEELGYARAVAARVIEIDGNVDAALIAEERLGLEATAELSSEALRALAAGARRLWLLSPLGPVAALDLEADGGAEFVVLEGPRNALREVRRLNGVWRAEGYRRGRLARQVRLRRENGAELIVLLGYEPTEYEERRDELIAAARALAF